MTIVGLEPVRVLLIDLHGILSEIILSILEDEPGVEVAGQQPRTAGLDEIAAVAADVVIAPSDGEGLADVWRELLARRPQTKVLTVGGDGRDGFLYELRPYRVPLGEICPRTLIEAVKSPRVFVP